MKNFLLTLVLFSTLIGNAQWQDLGTGMTTPSIEIFGVSVVDANTVWAVGNTWPDYVDEFTKTLDGGNTWQTGALPALANEYFTLSVRALDANTAWVLMTIIPTQDSCRLFKTIDGGTNWTEQFGGFNQANWALAIMHFFDENNGVLYGSAGTGNPVIDSLHIHTTIDGGSSWNRVPFSNLPFPLQSEGSWIASGNGTYAAIGDTMWAVTRAQRVFKTVDKGETWQAYSVAGASNLRAVAFKDPMNGITIGISPNYIGTTNDGGLTWTDATVPFPIAYNNIQYIPGSSDMYVISSGSDSELIISRDGGATWVSENHLISLKCIEFISPTIGYGGNMVQTASTGGMYKWAGNISTSITEKNVNDVTKIYPNPVKDILYFKSDNVVSSIKLIDALGRVMNNHSVDNSVDVSEFPLGIYFLMIETEEGVVTRKFVKE